MAVRIFNKKWTRRLEANGDPKDFVIIKPYSFATIDEKYTGDITFQMGVKAGDIEVFETKQQGDAIAAKAETEPAVTIATPKKKGAKKVEKTEE